MRAVRCFFRRDLRLEFCYYEIFGVFPGALRLARFSCSFRYQRDRELEPLTAQKGLEKDPLPSPGRAAFHRAKRRPLRFADTAALWAAGGESRMGMVTCTKGRWRWSFWREGE